MRFFQRFNGVRRRVVNFTQCPQQSGVRLLEKTSGELMQKAADIFSRVDKQLAVALHRTPLMALRLLQRVFKRARHFGQGLKSNGGRAARQ